MRIERNRALMTILADCIIDGRFSTGYLEFRRGTYTRSNPVIEAMIETLAQEDPLTGTRPAFHRPTLTTTEFHQSRAYASIIELGLPPEETAAALTPYQIVDKEEPAEG